jgi:hypothetical protein
VKTKIVSFFGVALAVGFLTATSVQAVPTTYQYTGNPFTNVSGPYTTSDFVSGMVTLAGRLRANMPLTTVTPTAFTLSDGVQTISNLNAADRFFQFATGATGEITFWTLFISGGLDNFIATDLNGGLDGDTGLVGGGEGIGQNVSNPGSWRVLPALPDAGSTVSLMTLTLMALGVATRQFKRAAA